MSIQLPCRLFTVEKNKLLWICKAREKEPKKCQRIYEKNNNNSSSSNDKKKRKKNSSGVCMIKDIWNEYKSAIWEWWMGGKNGCRFWWILPLYTVCVWACVILCMSKTETACSAPSKRLTKAATTASRYSTATHYWKLNYVALIVPAWMYVLGVCLCVCFIVVFTIQFSLIHKGITQPKTEKKIHI